MLYLSKNSEDVYSITEWVCSRDNWTPHRNNDYAMASLGHDNRILCAVIYFGYDGNNILISFATDGPSCISPKALYCFLDFPFGEPFNCNRISALVAEANMRSRRLVEYFGFREEGILRDHPSIGMKTSLYGLLKSDWQRRPQNVRQRREWLQLLS